MELKDFRARIDRIDDELVRLFVQRMQISGEIADYKKEHHVSVLNKSREREILSKVSQQAGEELEGYTRILFSTIFDLGRSYQNVLINEKTNLADQIASALENTPKIFPKKGVVACQGIEGAYSQLACDKLFSHANIMYFRNFEGVFNAVEQGLCEYGILPIENSSYGSVNAVYDLMRGYQFHIIKGIKLHISHALLAKPDTKQSDIREIFSHEQALGQCSEFLRTMPDVKLTVCENTAVAAKMVAESNRNDVAAISSTNCSELYGLTILKHDIQNTDHNYTRFICISKEMQIYPGASKISIMLSLEHTPGALAGVLSKFSALGLNVAKLESRPIPGKDFEFLFYFDIDASIYSPEVMNLLCELDRQPGVFVFLGSYVEL